jgi:hypothetical protein
LINPNELEYQNVKSDEDQSHQTKYLSQKSLFTDMNDKFQHEVTDVRTDDEKEKVV